MTLKPLEKASENIITRAALKDDYGIYRRPVGIGDFKEAGAVDRPPYLFGLGDKPLELIWCARLRPIEVDGQARR